MSTSSAALQGSQQYGAYDLRAAQARADEILMASGGVTWRLGHALGDYLPQDLCAAIDQVETRRSGTKGHLERELRRQLGIMVEESPGIDLTTVILRIQAAAIRALEQ